MNSELEPPWKKNNPSPSSFSSLPDEIIVNCLARISKSYYPKLSLVSKTFCSHLLSMELYYARMNLETHENVLHVCLKLPNRLLPSWYSLWINPNQTLTNDIGKKEKKTLGSNTLLVSMPSSYSPRVPMFIGEVGSQVYAISKHESPSSVMWVRDDKSIYAWRKAPSMKVARSNAIACVLGEKIYVMGGCKADESADWAEVFDTKTQTWESLPDPGEELRGSWIKTIEVTLGKIYVKNSENMIYVYDLKEGKWSVQAREYNIASKCEIDNVVYRCCGRQNCMWYDTKCDKWRDVKGLAGLNRHRGCDLVEIVNYNGKLLVLWEKFTRPRRQKKKNIWCAVIALEKRGDDKVWGKIEWASIVLSVPDSYVFLRCEVKPV